MSTTTVTVGSPTLTAVNPTRSFVVCSSRNPGSNAAMNATCELTGGGTTLTFTNNSAGTTVVQWHVVEFTSGVSVQRGLASLGTTELTKTVAVPGLTAATLPKSFVLISQWTYDTSDTGDEGWTVTAQLSTVTPGNLVIDRTGTSGGNQTFVAWQVVTMDSASVQRGTTSIGTTFPYAALSTTVTLGTPVTAAESFLVMSRRSGSAVGGVEGYYQVNGQLNAAGTEVTFTRASAAGLINTGVDIYWEVVSPNDGTSVQRGSVTALTTELQKNVSLSPNMDANATIPLLTVSGGFGGYPPGDLDPTSWTGFLSAANNLRLDRHASASTDVVATVAWQAISFLRAPSSASAPSARQTPSRRPSTSGYSRRRPSSMPAISEPSSWRRTTSRQATWT